MHEHPEHISALKWLWLMLPLWVHEIIYAAVFSLLVTAVTAAVRCFLRRRKGIAASWGHEAAVLLFTAYLAALFSLVWTPLNFWTYLFSPYDEIKLFQFAWESVPYTLRFLLSGDWIFSFHFYKNVLLMLPMGFFLPLLDARLRHGAMWLKTIAVISLVIELGQIFLSGRSFDWTDVVSYLVGCIIGFGTFLLFSRFFPGAADKTAA